MECPNINNENHNNINVCTVHDADTSHPVFKKLAKLNGQINRMSIEQLKAKLTQLGIESTGSMDSCKRRLKHHYKSETMSKVFKKQTNFYYDVICVVDFEATCEKESEKDSIQEIIEFPAFMVDLKQKQISSRFHEFVKPRINFQLSKFCTSLTGITQQVVDKADYFPDVLDRFENWFFSYIKDNNVTSFALATDGPWDLCHFLACQCELDKIPFPSYAKRWINIRKVFSSHYKTQHLCLNQMLSHLGLEFEGRRHSGYDDAFNIANVLIRMVIDGANPVINERISWHQSDRQRWGQLKYGCVRVFYNKPHDGLNVSDSEDSITDNIDYEDKQ